jgi:cytochrome c oxidase subunit IV
MADHAHLHTHDDAQGHGHGGVGKYVMVFVALCALTAISFAVGNSQSLRENSPGTMWAMMMAVSCAKAMLVILFFMHILWEANWKYVLTIPASMMSIFLMLMLVPDIGRRTDKYAEERWLHAAEPQAAPAHEAETGEQAQEHGHDHGQPATKSGAAH